MWGNSKVFYDLVGSAVGDRRNLQAFIDSTKEAYNKLDISGFNWSADLLPDFSFEQVSREYGINAMATWVDLDSSGTPISVEGDVIQTGKIPRARKYGAFDEHDYRRMMITNVAKQDIVSLAQDALFNINRKLIDAHTNSITYMRHQMVSRGKFELTDSNNPSGITGTVFSASIPDENKVTLAGDFVWWKANGDEGSKADPIGNLKDMGDKVKGIAYHYEVDALTLKRTLRHSRVLEAIGYSLHPTIADAGAAVVIGSNLVESQKKARLEEILGYPIVAIESISRVDKYDKSKRAVVGEDVRSFDPKSWALIPDGQIGETLAVAPYLAGDKANFATYHGGRLLITYEFDSRKKTQIMESELTALVVPDKPNYMYILTI